MRGFTDKGIMLMPKEETWNSRGIDYQLSLRKSVNAAIAYFKSLGITMHCFTTNDVALKLNPKGVEWVDCSAPEDIFFIKKNVEGFSNIPSGLQIDEIYDETRKKIPVGKGLSIEERFEIVEKRDKMSANNYIAEQKLVVTFEHPQNSYYKVAGKADDGRIIFKVSHINFLVTCVLSGNPIDAPTITGYNGATRPIYMWEAE